VTTVNEKTILCLASYEKGHDFLRESKRQGARVVLLTSLGLQHKAHWPMESVDEIFYMPDQDGQWNRQHTLNTVSYLARSRTFSRIVPLDDFDVEVGAMLREHMRVAGMGESTARHFRDKLAMRMKARDANIRVPEFVHVLNHDAVREFMERVPAPWVLKPRSLAGAMGIKKIRDAGELWKLVTDLGDLQSHYLLEQFVPGDVFHADTIVREGQVVFAAASEYGRPPMEVSHEGGVFVTRILNRRSEVAGRLIEMNARVLTALGMTQGVSHTEFIRGRDDNEVYFLETSARVGGAHIAELVEAATGVNLWKEWAKLEIHGSAYQPPDTRHDYAGLLVSLARQQHPDTSDYNDSEVVWRMQRDYHVGLIVRSADEDRVKQLIASYASRVANDFFASLPPRDRPTA
jgi:ATP-grasp domain